MKEIGKILAYPRGSVWKCNLGNGDIAPGVQSGYRPVVIISDNKGNQTNSSVLVAMITSNSDKSKYAINVPFINEQGDETVILCNQIKTVNKSILKTFMGMLPSNVMFEVEKAIKYAMGMSEEQIDLERFNRVIDRIIASKREELTRPNVNITQDVVDNIAIKVEDLFRDLLIPMEIKASNNRAKEIQEKAPIATSFMSATKPAAEEAQQTNNQLKDTDKNEIQKKKNPRGFWTRERKLQFIEDKEKMELSALIEKYNLSNGKTAMQMYYTFKTKLDG